jgi:hypothetical protein
MNATASYSFSEAQPEPFTRNDAIGYGSVATLAAVTLGLARWLTPSPNGFGTHQQLGLPACTFLHYTGFPCPSCGLTTCFAHAAHGQFFSAFLAQPFGLLLFGLTALAIPFVLYCLRRRVPWSAIVYARFTNRVMRWMLVLYLLSWGYKIYAMRGWQ